MKCTVKNWGPWAWTPIGSNLGYFWGLMYNLGQKYYASELQPNEGSNSSPPDHMNDSIFHATETPALATRPTVTSLPSYMGERLKSVPLMYLKIWTSPYLSICGCLFFFSYESSHWKVWNPFCLISHHVTIWRLWHECILWFVLQFPCSLHKRIQHLSHLLFLHCSFIIPLLFFYYSNTILIVVVIYIRLTFQEHQYKTSWSLCIAPLSQSLRPSNSLCSLFKHRLHSELRLLFWLTTCTV